MVEEQQKYRFFLLIGSLLWRHRDSVFARVFNHVPNQRPQLLYGVRLWGLYTLSEQSDKMADKVPTSILSAKKDV
jgi:hypothetical protein